jgi:RND family efflux transporter MFP subunit
MEGGWSAGDAGLIPMARMLALLGLAGLLSACGDAPSAPLARPTLPAGETLHLQPSTITDMKAVGAEITTQDQAEALARIAGILTVLSVREGDTVAKGQRIGMVVDNRLGYESAAFGAQIAAAQAEASRADAELARVRFLYQKNVYAKARLDQAVAASRAARAQVTAARAQQGAVTSVAGQGAILAPASGRVLKADVPQGSAVAPGLSVATITAGPPVLRLDLPESLAGKVRIGSRIMINEQDSPSGSRQGQVVQAYPAITGGRVRVDATLPGLASTHIGQRVSVLVETGQRSALVIPRTFVSTRYGMDYVDVLTRDKALSSVPVQTAPAADPQMVEILSGIVAGDTLFAASAAR